MAYVDNSNSDNGLLDANGNPLSLNTANSGNIGQNNGTGQGITNQVGSGQNSTGPKGSGEIVPIDKYTQANTQAIPGLANSLSDSGVKQVNNVEGQINTQKNALTSLLSNENTNIGNDQAFVNNSINNAINGGNLLGDTDLSNYKAIQAGKNDYSSSATPQLDASTQQLQLGNLQKQNLVGSEADRTSALQSLFGSGNEQYGMGAQTLDSALLQSNPTALSNANKTIQDKVIEANNQLGDISNQIATQRQNDINAGQALQYSSNLTPTTGAPTSALSSALTNFQNGLNTQAGQYSNNLVNTGKTLQSELSQGYIDPTLFASLSPSVQAQLQNLASSGTSIGNVGSTNFLNNITPTAWTPDANGNYTMAQLGQSATAQNLAAANALGQLSGSGNTFLPGTVGGGYQANDLGLQNLAGDIAARQAAQNDAYNKQLKTSANLVGDLAYGDFGKYMGAGDINNPVAAGAFNSQFAEPVLEQELRSGKAGDSFVGGNPYGGNPNNTSLSAALLYGTPEYNAANNVSGTVTQADVDRYYNQLGVSPSQAVNPAPYNVGFNMLNDVKTQYNQQLAALQALQNSYNQNPFQIRPATTVKA